VQVLATGYHNCAAEYEFLKSYPEALVFYQKAVKLCQAHLGVFSNTTVIFQKHFEEAKRNIQRMIQNDRGEQKRPDSVKSKLSLLSKKSSVSLPPLKNAQLRSQ